MIYLISPPKISLDSFEPLLESILQTGKISVFQLRLKECLDDEIIASANILVRLCHKYSIQFILNDRADLAKLVNADGVHIGKEDGSVENARKILGPNKIIGVSCYDSIDRAMEVGEAGADYIAFGAFYPTTTKLNTAKPKIDILEQWTSISVLPCVAIGGINQNNCKPLIKAGADLIAVVSNIWGSEDPVKATLELAASCEKTTS